MVDFLRTVCIYTETGVAVNQEEVHEKIFYYPEAYNKILIPVAFENNRLTLLLSDESKKAEQFVDLYSFFENGKLIKYESEINYFTKLIGVFSALCKGRNYVSKSSIEHWFPLEFLLNIIWDEKILKELRASFLDLLISMHIDFLPRIYIQKPELIITPEVINNQLYPILFKERHSFWEIKNGFEMIEKIQKTIQNRKISIESEPETIKNEIKVSEDEFQMFELKCKLLDKFEKLKEGEFDCFVLQMLKLAKMMIQFEIISMEESDLETRICKRQIEDFANIDLYRLLSAIKKIFDTSNSGLTKGIIPNKKESLLESQILNKSMNFEISEEPFANYLEGVQKYIQFQSDRVEKKNRINMKYEGEESTDSKYIEQYLSRNYKDEGESNEYMPLKPTPYMLEKPFYHQERLQAGETSSDIKH